MPPKNVKKKAGRPRSSSRADASNEFKNHRKLVKDFATLSKSALVDSLEQRKLIAKSISQSEKSISSNTTLLSAVLDNLLLLRKELSKKKVMPKLEWPDYLELLVVIFALFQFLLGNGLMGLRLLFIWGFVRVLRGIFSFYLKDRSSNKLNFLLTGVGAFTIALLALFGQLPVYNLNGTEDCRGDQYFAKINDDNSYSLEIDDVAAKLANEKRSFIQITTRILSDGNFTCKGCQVQEYLKPDNNDGESKLTQRAPLSLTFSPETTKFLLIQQLFFADASIPGITDSRSVLRSCECNISKLGEVNCDSSPLTANPHQNLPSIYTIDFDGNNYTIGWLGTRFFAGSKNG